MKEALAIIAGVLLGSGLGLLLSEQLSGILLQPFISSFLAVSILVIKVPKRYWTSALALSLASAITGVSLRIAVSTLLLYSTNNEAALLIQNLIGSFPMNVFDRGFLILVGLSITVTFGQLLLLDGLNRFFSPLWRGMEALPTSFHYSLEVKPRDTLLGAPVGLAAAVLDTIALEMKFSSFPFWCYVALLSITTSSLSTVFTAVFNTMILLVVKGLFPEFFITVQIGVQLGIAVTTAVAAILLHSKRGASRYHISVVSIGALAGGLLILILSYSALAGPQWSAYLAFLTIVMSFFALIIAFRSEGGFLLPITSFTTQEKVPSPVTPVFLWLLWSWLSGFFDVKIKPLGGVLLNPSLLLLLAVQVLWGYRLSGNGFSTFILLLAIGAPAVLFILRGIKPEFAHLSRYYALRLGLEHFESNVDVAGVLAVAAVTAVVCFGIYYILPATSRLRYFKMFTDPTGLMVAFGLYSRVLTAFIWSFDHVALVAIASIGVVRLLLLTRRIGTKIRRFAIGSLNAYGIFRAFFQAVYAPSI
ncbi:MAG: hypothetical protein NZ954_06560 [Thermofilaceae archaeon]|nr:hypothetical protein [Thermofilaceae archaeon]MCX8180639.1 hypothetical protein [Thermofilaceae archaeon]MDW8003743.1 hypothetical protein [Thermofilaceae archaeon]